MSFRSCRRLFNGLLELVDGCTVWELLILNMPVRLPGNPTPYLLRQCLLHTPMEKKQTFNPLRSDNKINIDTAEKGPGATRHRLYL